MNISKLMVLALSLSLGATACHKHPDYTTKIPGGANGLSGSGGTNDLNNGIGITNPPAAGEQSGTPQVDSSNFANYTRDAEVFKSDTVHFDFDSSVVKADEKSKVTAVADYLKSNSGDAVQIEGHCDERGTEEYNRALGERRALALREDLIQDGVDGGKVITISYGKDRPVDPGHNEAAWSQNRRGVFILLTPPKTQ